MRDNAEVNARSEPRRKLFMAGYLKSQSRTEEVFIRDLSSGGALIECAHKYAGSEALSLRRGLVEVQGHIAWRNGDKAGLNFDEPIRFMDWLPGKQRKAGAQPWNISQSGYPVLSELSKPSAAEARKLCSSADRPTTNADLQAALLKLRESLQECLVVAGSRGHLRDALRQSLSRFDKLIDG